MRVAVACSVPGRQLPPAATALPAHGLQAGLRCIITHGIDRVRLHAGVAHMGRGVRATDRNHDGIFGRNAPPGHGEWHGPMRLRACRRSLAAHVCHQDVHRHGAPNVRERAAPPR